MIGERPLSFYRSLNKIENVTMLRLDQYPSSLDWIIRSLGVVTLSGSSALEATLVSKKSLIFGETTFSRLKGVSQVMSFEEIPILLSNLVGSPALDNRDDRAKYIGFCSKEGLLWPMHSILKEAKSVTSQKSNASRDLNLFIEAYIDRGLSDV